MPEYTYRCRLEECNHSFDITHSIKSPPILICPLCGESTLERVIYGGVHVSCSPGVTTIGALAEKNAKKFGKYGVQERDRIEQERVENSTVSEGMKEAIRKSGGRVLTKEEKAGKKAWYWGKDDPVEKRNKLNKMTPEQKQRYIVQGD